MGFNKNKIVFLRHGESQWNLENRFTGWTDVTLSKKGCEEAKNAGKLLSKNNLKFDLVYTSFLERAIKTTQICLKHMSENHDISIKYDWRINERHYGALQGLNKSETIKKYGKKQVLIWRRSYKTAPPLLELEDKRHPKFDLKYKNLKAHELPKGESLEETAIRVKPLWEKAIIPGIQLGKRILIVAHGNSLRAIIKMLDKISDTKIVGLNIPTGIPLVYELNDELAPIKKYYLAESKILKKIN